MTHDDLMSICLGEIGMSRRDFWESEYREIICAIHGHRTAVRERDKLSWEQTREIVFNTLRGSANIKPGSLSSSEEVLSFPWDKKKKTKSNRKIDPEVMAKIFQLWDNEQRIKHGIEYLS